MIIFQIKSKARAAEVLMHMCMEFPIGFLLIVSQKTKNKNRNRL